MVRKSVCTTAVCYCHHIGEYYWCDLLPHAGALGEDTREGLAPQYHHLPSRACAFGYQVLFRGNESCLLCVSCDSTVLAVLLSWSLSSCPEGLKGWGWIIFLLGNGGLGLAKNSCFQVNKNNALPRTNIEQKFYQERES